MFEMIIRKVADNDKVRYCMILFNEEIAGYADYWHISDKPHITKIAINQYIKNGDRNIYSKEYGDGTYMKKY